MNKKFCISKKFFWFIGILSLLFFILLQTYKLNISKISFLSKAAPPKKKTINKQSANTIVSLSDINRICSIDDSSYPS